MQKTNDFKQSDLIQTTGNKHPAGVCLGLVVQWLVAISKGTTGDESTFWSDLQASLASNESTPLFGVGYARQAIEFQTQYTVNNDGTGSSSYTRGVLSRASLTIESAISERSYGVNSNVDIARAALSKSGRYSILIIRGGPGAHAIGVYRKYSLTGKSSDVSVFDPNAGKWTASGENDVAAAIKTAMTPYARWSNLTYALETYN